MHMLSPWAAIHIDDFEVLPGNIRRYGIEGVKVQAIVLIVTNNTVRCFVVHRRAVCEIRAEDGSALLLVFGHGEAQRLPQPADEQLRKALHAVALLDHPPAAVAQQPAFFVGADVGQLRRMGVGPVEAVGVAAQGQGREMVLPEPHVGVGEALPLAAKPVGVGDGGGMHAQHGVQVVRAADAQGLFEKPRIGAVGVDGPAPQPGFYVFCPLEIQRKQGFIAFRQQAVAYHPHGSIP